MAVTLTITAADGAKTSITLADPVVGGALTAAWKPLTIGASGYCIGADMAADGFMVVRCDVANCYLLDTSALQNRWKNLFVASSWPSAYWDLWAGNPADSNGGHEIRFAPSQPTTLYCTTLGRLWKSIDRGTTWSYCPFPGTSLTSKASGVGVLNAASNDGVDKIHAQKLAIDPNNPNVVHLAFRQTSNTANGGKLAATYDGGQTFAFKPLPRGAPSGGVDLTCIAAAAAAVGDKTIMLVGNVSLVAGDQFWNATTAHWYGAAEVVTATYNAASGQTAVSLSAPLDKPVAANDSIAIMRGTYGVVGICYDRDSPILLSNGRTAVLYASPFWRGVWRSMDAGESWSCIGGWYAEGQPTTKLPGPRFVREAKVYKGALYCIQLGNNYLDDGLWRWTQAGGWTQLTKNVDIAFAHTTAVSFDFDPFVPDRMIAITGNGRINISLDAGTTWSGWSKRGSDASSLDVSDIPWFKDIFPYALSVANVFFDKHVQNRAWTSGSSSPWYVDVPTTIVAPNTDSATTTVPTWHAKGKDIEELVSNWVLAIPGNPNHKVLCASWDAGLFNITPGQQPQHSVVPALCATTAPTATWDMDYAAQSPGYVFAWSDNWYSHFGSAYPMVSSDFGETWKFVKLPPKQGVNRYAFGSVACCGAGKFIYAGWMGLQPQYTVDEGATWGFVSISDATKNDGLGTVTQPGSGWIPDNLTVGATKAWALGDLTLQVPVGSGVIPGMVISKYGTVANYQAGTILGTVGRVFGYDPATGIVTLVAGAACDGLANDVVGASAWGAMGFLGSNWATHRPFCADRVLADTYYLMLGTANQKNSGCYRSTDAGKTWQRRNAAPINWGYYPVHEIAAVPGHAGHLFVSSLTNTTARFSNDGGVTWMTVSSAMFRGPFCVGFGAPKVPGHYPSIYVVGYYSPFGAFDKKAYGIYRIDDFDPATGNGTFVPLGAQYPSGNTCPNWAIAGDMDLFGRVYLVPKNYGFQYGDFI